MKKELQVGLNIQYFAADPTISTADDLGEIKSIDFVNKFEKSLKELLLLLGVTRKIALSADQKIVTYKWSTELQSGKVAEGEIIPLSKVTRKKDKEYEAPLGKYRKQVTIESIRRNGYSLAVDEADRKLERGIQNEIKNKFVDFLAAAPTALTAPSLQSALANAWAKTETLFEGAPVVSLVNPMDVAEFLGKDAIAATQSTDFGLTLLTNYLNQNVILLNSVPQGTVYTTAVENLVMAYADVNGDMSRPFDLVTDDTGYIGASHKSNTDNASVDTLLITGIVLFAELADGVIQTAIVKSSEDIESVSKKREAK